MNVNIWKGERKKMDTGSAQWHLEIGQEAMGTMRNTIKSVQTKKGGKLPWMTEQWHRFSGKMVESACLETSKTEVAQPWGTCSR